MSKSDALPIDILLVEVSPTEAELAIEALREGKISKRLHHIRESAEAVPFLNREDVQDSYELTSNAYIVKLGDSDRFTGRHSIR